jgi:hypothetical protein
MDDEVPVLLAGLREVIDLKPLVGLIVAHGLDQVGFVSLENGAFAQQEGLVGASVALSQELPLDVMRLTGPHGGTDGLRPEPAEPR